MAEPEAGDPVSHNTVKLEGTLDYSKCSLCGCKPATGHQAELRHGGQCMVEGGIAPYVNPAFCPFRAKARADEKPTLQMKLAHVVLSEFSFDYLLPMAATMDDQSRKQLFVAAAAVKFIDPGECREILNALELRHA